MPKSNQIPEFLPVLSVGRHRSPKRGACFMEYASHLAGERWSDHPTCTHAAIAALARAVNDCTSDDARGRLVPLIPSVIGLHGPDERVRLIVSVRASAAALPVASESRQRAISVGLAHCEALLENRHDEMAEHLRSIIRGAFEQAPSAEKWARAFLASVGTTKSRLDSWTVDKMVALSIIGMAEACISDADDRLFRLLSSTIDDCVRDAAVSVPKRNRVQERSYERV
ncbi:hypothetical protein ABIE21_001294 [Conyzicola nivalis]|uniref:Uncharacterized protein n=1 Tax=Conyzicola nivalis TaxID=1477021 RepID=A0ABV2QL76_9MICO